eukprot:366889-Prymnesium_polylepis.1
MGRWRGAGWGGGAARALRGSNACAHVGGAARESGERSHRRCARQCAVAGSPRRPSAPRRAGGRRGSVAPGRPERPPRAHCAAHGNEHRARKP